MSISRKRLSSILASDSPHAKRHLSAALAAELNELRIGSTVYNRVHRAEPFGAVTHSPFLQPNTSQDAALESSSGEIFHQTQSFGFGESFGESLGFRRKPFSRNAPIYEQDVRSAPLGDVKVTVSTPRKNRENESEMSDLNAASNDSGMESNGSVVNIDLTQGASEQSFDDMSDMDVSQQLPDSRAVVVYRPLSTSAADMARIRARMPNAELHLNDSSQEEWVLRYHERDSVKRKLALIPYTASRRKLTPFDAIPSAAIPMPWHESDEDQMQT